MKRVQHPASRVVVAGAGVTDTVVGTGVGLLVAGGADGVKAAGGDSEDGWA